MVDVSLKPYSLRSAEAEATLSLPPEAWSAFLQHQAPVLSAAFLAGTAAAKRTSDWVTLCHALPIDAVLFSATVEHSLRTVVIRCQARSAGRTGVEMEALVGASAAALNAYDMLKAASPCIVIREIKLIRKSKARMP